MHSRQDLLWASWALGTGQSLGTVASGFGFDQGPVGLREGRMDAAYLKLQGLLQLELVVLPGPFQAVQLLV